MNNDMKCPFCGQELKNINFIWFCENESCRAYDWTMEEAAWQELIRARKALKITTNAIDEILYLDSGKFCKEPAEMWKIAKSAKDKITALTKGGDNE